MPSNGSQSGASKKQKWIKIVRILIELLVSVVLILSAIFLCRYVKSKIPKEIVEAVALKPESDGFKNWLNPPITTTRGYYLFNISNPIGIVTDPASATIRLTETRPYVYRVQTKKNNYQWSKNKKRLRYEVERIFERDPKLFDPNSVNDTGVFVDMLRATFRTQFGPKPSPSFFTLGGTETFYRRNAVEQLEGFTSDLFKAMKDKMVGPNTAMSGYVYRHNGSRLYNMTITTSKTIFHAFLL